MTKLEQVTNRENRVLRCAEARLSLGRDGRVYLTDVLSRPDGIVDYVLSLAVDGTGRRGVEHRADRVELLRYVTANAAGYLARADTHREAAVTVLDPQRQEVLRWRGMRDNELLDAPARVEAGASGRFYVLAQYGIDGPVDPTKPDPAQPHLVDVGDGRGAPPVVLYPLKPLLDASSIVDFRVRDAAGVDPVFFVLYRKVSDGKQHLAKIDQAGRRVAWDRTDEHIQDLVPHESGGFDVDDEGRVHLVRPVGDQLYRYPDDGTSAPVALPLPANRPKPTLTEPYRELRIWRQQVVLQRKQDREFYSAFALPAAGATAVVFQKSVLSRYDVLSAEIPDEQPWTAGTSVTVTLTIDRSAGDQERRLPAPQWRAWVRSPGAQDHREFPVTPDPQSPATRFQLAVPATASGLVQLTLSPDTAPYRLGAPPPFRVRRIIEIRPAGATGSANVSTVTRSLGRWFNGPVVTWPVNRTRYAVGEPITFSASVRQDAAAAKDIVLRLDDISGATPLTVASATVTVPAGKPLEATVPAAVTAVLKPGRYLLTAVAAGLAIAAQPIELGSGQPLSSHRRTWAADLVPHLYPAETGHTNTAYFADHYDVADLVAAHLERVRLLGWTIVLDRIGFGGATGNIAVTPARDYPELTPLITRLATDRRAIDPVKSDRISPLLDVISGFGAMGVQQRAVLLGNDVLLPLAELRQVKENFDDRRPIARYYEMFQANTVLMAYRAFGGWHWALNWWTSELAADQIAGDRNKDEPYIANYVTALKEYKANGTWSPLLGAMAAHATSHGPDLQRQLKQVLMDGAGAEAARLVTAAPGPLPHVAVYPPHSFTEVDEVDLQAQWEQFPLFLHTAFLMDYLARPDKPSVLHPQSDNDGGNGEQVLGHAFAALLRGANTSGHAEWVPTYRERVPDPRDDVAGTVSTHRVLGEFLHEYGGWVSSFEGNDPVVILLSRRQFATQYWEWGWIYFPEHFARVYEAYVSLLYAQIPANVVFVEDLSLPDARPLTDYAAVLLVDEQTEFDTPVLTALAAATAAGVPVFHDGNCRQQKVLDRITSQPLGVTFGLGLRAGFRQVGDDSCYREWRRIALTHRPALLAALDGPAAERVTSSDPDVLVSERIFGDHARLVLAFNNALFDVDTPVLRRAAPAVAVKAPLPATLALPPEYRALKVYDVLAGTQVTLAADGKVAADLRHWPIALYALLPEAVGGVRVAATVAAGGVSWSVKAVAESGTELTVPVPVRIRVLDENNAVLWQQNTESPASGVFTAPANARGKLRVEAVELLTGRAAVDIAGAVSVPLPMGLLAGPGASTATPDPAAGTAMTADWRPAAQRLGAFIRETALTGDGAVVLATANWDSNLYAIELANGQPRWQSRIGQHFTFGPQPVADALVVRGSMLDAPNGYGLHLVNTLNGTVERRFDLNGTQPRWFRRKTTRDNDGRPPAFAVPASGAWVATAGNLGIAVWKRDGTPLWKTEWWAAAPPTERVGVASDALLVSLNENTLLVASRDKVTSYQAGTGTVNWSRNLVDTVSTVDGRAFVAAVSPDGLVCALGTTYDSGRLLLLKTATGEVVADLPAEVDELGWSPDGKALVVLRDTRLEQYRLREGSWVLDRSYPAGDVVHNLAIAADGRIACGDEQGKVLVLDAEFRPLWIADVGGLAIPRWLPADGDLLVATRLGQVSRRDARTYQPKWSTVVTSKAADMRGRLLAPETRPVSRITGIGNGTVPPSPLPASVLVPGVDTVKFKVELGPAVPEAVLPASVLGPNPVPPERPLLTDLSVDLAAHYFPAAYLLVLPKAAVTFDSLTLHDDPAHPESWLRDVQLEVRDGPGVSWRKVARLVSDLPSRTYRGLRDPADAAKPVTAKEIRLVVPQGVFGNVRLAGLALHRLG